jgi:hypothetical protein
MHFFEIPVHVSINGHVSVDVRVHLVEEHEHRERTLVGAIGPITEQGGIIVANQALTLTDSQKANWGPFNQVDKKGVVIGLASGLSISTGDASILTAVDNGDGTFSLVAGIPGQTQATVTDGVATGVLDITVIAGAEAGLVGAVSAPVEQ